jgi:hypothetical protein
MQLLSILFSVITLALFAGCGGGDPAGSVQAVSKLSDSSRCLTCHATATSPGTGALITDEWRASTHNLNNGAGCADCHEPPANHPNESCNACHGGSSAAVTKNADQAGKCLKCHGPSFPSDHLMARTPQHFGYSTATALPQTKRASYVSGQYQGRCRACHNPHQSTVTQQHREYAKSLHGAPEGEAWTHYDFKDPSRNACIRCHTSTGFISFVSNNFTVPANPFLAGDTTRELLACDACHSSYDFKKSIRQVPAFTAPYLNFNGSANATFPDTGKSNLCVPCHAGRQSGQNVMALTDDKFSNVGFVNPHYLAAAGLMYMQNGFTNFTAASATLGSTTYGRTLSPDSASTPGGLSNGTASTHRKLGTPAIHGDSHKPAFFLAGVLDQNGPCVTCHLNGFGSPMPDGSAARPGSGHSLKIDANAFNQVCVNCHPSENTVTLTAGNFLQVFIEPQAEAFESALELMQHILLTKYDISFNKATNPYFFDEHLPLTAAGAKQPVKDWTRGGTTNGRKLMGACYNFNLLKRDPAAYAHARSYSRRLIYDSIDFLDDGIMNLSVGQTALNSGLLDAHGALLFQKGDKAYTATTTASGTPAKFGITTPYTSVTGDTSEAMLYLIAWLRSGTAQDPAGTDHVNGAGSWAAIERP